MAEAVLVTVHCLSDFSGCLFGNCQGKGKPGEEKHQSDLSMFQADTDDAHPPGPPHAVANSMDSDRLLSNT